MPSKRHIELQNMVARWIGNRSFKMCGLPEVGVIGYIADFVALAGMNNEYHTRYSKHSGLTKKYMTTRKTDEGWERKVFGDIDRYYVCVFEVKVSRSDFLNTFAGKDTSHAKARMQPVGTAHWVVAEKGICKPEELPDFWGLLEPYGAGLTERKKPKLNVLPDSELHLVAFEMLWLQMNYRRSYYEQMIDMAKTIKEVQKAIRHKEPEADIRQKCAEAVRACRGCAF